ncbi:hypothetical protein EON63_09220 [archaeon]|nr:MAG: hypothetical protein EON63_09220 [archaeon]
MIHISEYHTPAHQSPHPKNHASYTLYYATHYTLHAIISPSLRECPYTHAGGVIHIHHTGPYTSLYHTSHTHTRTYTMCVYVCGTRTTNRGALIHTHLRIWSAVY